MGWTVLYIAFGVVALWLLGEVLLQYKARLRWRLLAFAGFLGVVLGVLIPSVVVIGLGAIAFAVGQTYVTLSFRRGFASGWAVSRPGADGGKTRRGRGERRDPTLEVSDLEPADSGPAADDGSYASQSAYGHDDDHDDVFTPARPPAAAAAETTMIYEPQPLPEDTRSYGVYGDTSAYASTAQPAAGDQSSAYGYDYSGYGQYGYDTTGQQQYAAYSDPYIGTQTYGGASYDTTYGGQYDQQGYGQDPYAGGYGQTPAGGVWVPQQRTDDTYGGELPQEQPYPYDQGTGTGQQQAGHGYDEQYRF
ncbi:hypothetical protein C3489_17010 [Streptomyces sp. Ru71]|uniref:SCO2102 family sporulation regulator n=1 Tax=Streptomyces sp. Ru71 TaxID=2080746 RepID=UPI000CDD2425|nr:hypothetical protein [Streptomyces sp. Ru71]POX52947.1 hypothetical protein C3489_17010 [Streptomyces sp. Ru71]